MHTNGSHQETWAKRPVPEQQTFHQPDRLGVPLELMIAEKFAGDKAVVEMFSGITQLPGMERTMERYLRIWYENVGDLACLFAYINRPNQYGSWGNMGAYLGQPDSEAPRRRAILRLAKEGFLRP